MAELPTELQKLQSEVKTLAERVESAEEKLKPITNLGTKVQAMETVWAGATKDNLAILQSRYENEGEWSRHFSAVRMTVTPFLFTTSIGILAFKWRDPEGRAFLYVALAVWTIAMWLLIVFTYYARRTAQNQYELEQFLRGQLAALPGKPKRLRDLIPDFFEVALRRKPDQGFIAGVLLSVGFGFVLQQGFTLSPDTPKVQLAGPTTMTTTQPILVQFTVPAGESLPVVVKHPDPLQVTTKNPFQIEADAKGVAVRVVAVETQPTVKISEAPLIIVQTQPTTRPSRAAGQRQ